MAIVVSGTVFSWAVLGLLNLAVAWLIIRARPKGPANWIAGILIGTNTLFALKQVAVLSGWMEGGDEFGQAVDIFLAPPPFVAFMVFPFFFPQRRLSRVWERLVLAGAAGLVLVNWALLYGGFWVTGHLIARNAYNYIVIGTTMYLPFFLALAAGTILLLDTYVSSRSRVQRDQARLVLVAYLLKVSSFLAIIPTAVFGAWVDGFHNTGVLLGLTASAILVVPWLATPFTIGRSRLRKPAPGQEPRGWREDLFVLAAVAMAVAFYADSKGGGGLLEGEYMLLRPLLFAYAILQFQLLDIDIRKHGATFALIGVTAVAAVFIHLVRELKFLLVDPEGAAGLGLAVTLAVTWLFFQPILTRGANPATSVDARGRLLYRAALETALAAKPEQREAQAAVLRDLRGRLGIGEQEHAAIEANVRAILGEPIGRLEPGQVFLGHYRIVRPLAEGGFGAAFLARDETLDRNVVIKATRTTDADAARRALREARAVAKLRDPNIITLYHVDEVAGQVYLVMEYVERGSLADALAHGPLGWAASTGPFLHILDGLDAAHKAGLVHGDVKPANILLGPGGTAKLADFGVAHAIGPGTATASALTVPQMRGGSLHYMAPEQVRGLQADARSDLYSWAASWHEAITGRHYLEAQGSGDFDVRVAIVGKKMRMARGIPSPAREILAACLAKDPQDRPASAAAVREELAALYVVSSSLKGRGAGLVDRDAALRKRVVANP